MSWKSVTALLEKSKKLKNILKKPQNVLKKCYDPFRKNLEKWKMSLKSSEALLDKK